MKEHRPGRLKRHLPALVGLLLGGLCGALGARVLMPALAEQGSLQGLALLLLAVGLGLYAQIIFHELGHMVCGLLSGYRFVSFRIGKQMLAREKGRLRLRRFSVAGTGGQCLMEPPPCEDFQYPVVLYNLGGCLMNIALSLLCVLLNCFTSNPFVQAFLSMTAIFGVAFALLNGIPMEIGGIANDGRNVLALRSDVAARRAIWMQLTVNARMTDGERLGNMPAEWFVQTPGANLKNPLICTISVFAINRLHDLRRFDEARLETEQLFARAPQMLELYKNELRCELLFYALIDERKEDVARLDTTALQKYIRATRAYPARARLRYAYTLLHEEKTSQAPELRKTFEKATRTYPFTGEVQAERELMNLVDNLSKTF